MLLILIPAFGAEGTRAAVSCTSSQSQQQWCAHFHLVSAIQKDIRGISENDQKHELYSRFVAISCMQALHRAQMSLV
jgi:hypothetical protein